MDSLFYLFNMERTVVLLCVGSIVLACNRTLHERPNILYETEVLKMPNLECLSGEGVIFRNHCCTAPNDRKKDPGERRNCLKDTSCAKTADPLEIECAFK